MFDTASRPLAGIDAAVDHLLTVTHTTGPDPWSSATPAELMGVLESLQQLANLTSAAEQSLLAYAIDGTVFEDSGAASTADLLAGHLHLNRTEAHERARRAKRAAPRTTLTGEQLPAKYEHLAEAQAAGTVSGAHVDTVSHWLTKIEPHASSSGSTGPNVSWSHSPGVAHPTPSPAAGGNCCWN